MTQHTKELGLISTDCTSRSVKNLAWGTPAGVGYPTELDVCLCKTTQTLRSCLSTWAGGVRRGAGLFRNMQGWSIATRDTGQRAQDTGHVTHVPGLLSADGFLQIL